MKRYYIEYGDGTITVAEIDHDKRVEFWKNHPTATEISKEEFDNVLKLGGDQKDFSFYVQDGKK